jgi:hypothetical protein
MRQDIQHNDTQYNDVMHIDTQHKDLICARNTQHNNALPLC